MADEPNWEDIFSDQSSESAPKSARAAALHGTDGTESIESTDDRLGSAEGSEGSEGSEGAEAATPLAPSGEQPMTRREAREAQETRTSRRSQNSADPVAESSTVGPPRRKGRLWLILGLPLLVIALAGAAVAAYGWINYEEKIREVLGWEVPNDFEGAGNGEEVVVTVNSGDIGSDIARSLNVAGVTMTFDAFYNLLLSQETDPAFFPGNYSLQKEMSAQSALDALLDPENKVTDRLLITEGTTLPDALEIISETTGIALADVQAASEDLAHFELPAEAISLEGYLFPATYDLNGAQDPYAVLDLMVNTMYEKLDAAGVAVEDRYRILTMAALLQREAGPNTDDFYKIARVFYNRLDQDILLQSDATVAYGTGNLHTVWTTDAERADASNPYNTYANPGLPVGPIGLPGELAIDAAMNPVAGDWLFFVPINLATGETVFTTNVDDHEAAAQQLRDWCAENEENGSYC
ncbi:endolytic transglycosylase MltG [Rhodoglobus aureus]|uniref:Endolytic murein transglycosylase n=1 Tax=Rhodoglobus aureus TaxID=191497 RepID=A0ABP4GCC3_9MICO